VEVAHDVGEEQQAEKSQTSPLKLEPLPLGALKVPVTVPAAEIVPDTVEDAAPPQVTAEVGAEKLPLETVTVNV
jgi:hypothetical protein